jgi:hypothetical protein
MTFEQMINSINDTPVEVLAAIGKKDLISFGVPFSKVSADLKKHPLVFKALFKLYESLNGFPALNELHATSHDYTLRQFQVEHECKGYNIVEVRENWRDVKAQDRFAYGVKLIRILSSGYGQKAPEVDSKILSINLKDSEHADTSIVGATFNFASNRVILHEILDTETGKPIFNLPFTTCNIAHEMAHFNQRAVILDGHISQDEDLWVEKMWMIINNDNYFSSEQIQKITGVSAEEALVMYQQQPKEIDAYKAANDFSLKLEKTLIAILEKEAQRNPSRLPALQKDIENTRKTLDTIRRITF